MNRRCHWITQGNHLASQDPDLVIATLLGSCVAVCLWDPLSKVGGMNHMLLTSRKPGSVDADQAGTHAMELLINDILKLDGQRSRLVAKVFGGARMVKGLSDIGEANAQFTKRFLKREQILLLGESLGGSDARQLVFNPTTGVVRQRTVGYTPTETVAIQPENEGNGAEIWK